MSVKERMSRTEEKYKEYINSVFGNLIILEVIRNSKNEVCFKCKCNCGNVKTIRVDLVIKGDSKSCGCLTSKNLVGQTFGYITVIEHLNTNSHGCKIWSCECKCGTLIKVLTQALTSGNTRSCGCYNREVHTIHGFARNDSPYIKIYDAWNSLKLRCNSSTDTNYHNYGGRGITVCDEWNTSDPTPFITWSLANGWSPELSIDRRNNDGNYEPSNCRWVNVNVQSANRRPTIGRDMYTGVSDEPFGHRAYITTKNKLIRLGTHSTVEEAVAIRNKYIKDNNLPHPIQTI